MTTDEARQFFENFAGTAADVFQPLAASGSARMNYVASANNTRYILTANHHIAENESFLYLSQVFQNLKLNTPKIFTVSADRTMYVQEFLGTQTLAEWFKTNPPVDEIKTTVQQVLRKLYHLQKATFGKINFSRSYEYASYDELPVTSDLYYFKAYIADMLELPYHKGKLLAEFREIIERVSKLQPRGIMMRDFQARNIMLNDKADVFFIDYQAAMEGPLMYDVISFLYQASAPFTQAFRTEMVSYYYSLWKEEETVSALQQSFMPLKLIRFLQVLGAYGFRGLVQRKPHFISSLRPGILNLVNFTEEWGEMPQYPELRNLIQTLNSEDTAAKIATLINSRQR